jgi:hypothetical protein
MIKASAKRISGLILGCAAPLVAAALPACSSSDTSSCAVDATGVYVCADYVSAYPYDYAYVDPVYAGVGGYYPYTVDTYYDPVGYDYYIYSVQHVAAEVAAAGTEVPELLDKAHRAANGINYGVRAALDPVKELIKTQPTQNDNTVTFGPADHASGNYKFTMRQISKENKRYAWKLEARAKGSSGDFSLVAGGTMKVGDADRRGTGVLGVDCDKLGAADSAVTCRGRLLMGFSQPNGNKLLNVMLKSYTVDPAKAMALDANVVAWRVGDNANHLRIVTHGNLEESATQMPEDVVIKLKWEKDVGVRADAVATGGDIPSGKAAYVASCVGPGLTVAETNTTTRQCATDGTGCTVISGAMDGSMMCPSDLGTVDQPKVDMNASDPPAGMPEMPPAPSSIPDGSSNGDA